MGIIVTFGILPFSVVGEGCHEPKASAGMRTLLTKIQAFAIFSWYSDNVKNQ